MLGWTPPIRARVWVGLGRWTEFMEVDINILKPWEASKRGKKTGKGKRFTRLKSHEKAKELLSV